ncbi:hypothetical protein ACQFZT_004431 [Providencia stuartii]|uniref:hypothetical protein n=1 Tax=Providencia TaxID=586 RepID=UPI00234A5031|nr:MULTISPECIES: hypothetical protein [Providencia]MCR4081939.1 hypothetical protein [Providencia stuartii]MDE8748609.1 hypothetical protein [Providencia thailandensis]MDE8767904.1 hypothetical protein [Providencia thailandensis]MDE8780407.1 hypothetical protein [Providencia thailandensis]MDE8784404.1 hypothetical protein [Providencia thailandensis]
MRNILYAIALFSCLSVADDSVSKKQEFWYDGCPKYTDEQLEQLKGSKEVSTEELRTYSKKQLEDFVSKNECDVINLNERKKYLLEKLKKMDESANKQS